MDLASHYIGRSTLKRLKRRVSRTSVLTIFALGVLLFCTGPASLYATSAKSDEKVVICHFSGGKKNKTATLRVAKSALSAHLAHGDSIGACGYDPVISSNGYLLGPLQSGFSLATLVAVFGLVSLPGLARRRRDGIRR